MIVLNQFLPLVLNRLTIDCLLGKINKPARKLRVPAKVQDLARRWWEMLIAMEGPMFKPIKDTDSSAAICWACTEFCSRRERQNFNWTNCAGLFLIFLILFFCCQCVGLYACFGCMHIFQDAAFAVCKFWKVWPEKERERERIKPGNWNSWYKESRF